MPTAPEDYPLWATDPPNPDDVSEPSTERKEDGFMSTDYPVPYRWLNWLYTTIYAWIVYFNEEIPGLPRYDTLNEALSDLDTDQIGFVNEFETSAPLTVVASNASSSTGDVYVASNGVYLFCGQGTTIKAYSRTDLSTVANTYTLASAIANITKVKVSKDKLYVSNGVRLTSFTISDATRNWTEVCADTINDFDVFNGKIYIALANDTVLHCTDNGGSLTTDLTDTLDDEAFALCTDGVRLYVLRDADAITNRGTNFHIFPIGSGTAILSQESDYYPKAKDGTTKAKNILCCDSQAVYLALYAEETYISGETITQLKCLNFAGESVWTLELDYAPTSLTVDENWLYLATLTSDADNHAIYRIDKKTGTLNYYRDTAGSSDDAEVNPITSLISDGAKLFAGLGGATGTEKDWLKMNLGNEAPLIVQKRDNTNYHTTLDFLAKVR